MATRQIRGFASSRCLECGLIVPGNMHKYFDVELVKRAGNDLLPSQSKDDLRKTAIIDSLGEPEYKIKPILRARRMKRGRGSYHQALVKSDGWLKPT